MRLALVEDRTSLFPTLFLGHDESKRPRSGFPTSEAFSYAGEAYGSSIVQALSLTCCSLGAAFCAPVQQIVRIPYVLPLEQA